jgi:hypothetical protein
MRSSGSVKLLFKISSAVSRVFSGLVSIVEERNFLLSLCLEERRQKENVENL